MGKQKHRKQTQITRDNSSHFNDITDLETPTSRSLIPTGVSPPLILMPTASSSTSTMVDEPFPSVPTPGAPCVVTLPAHPCHREFPYAPHQQKQRLQDLLAEQRAQNKLASAFDQHVAFQNVRLARDGNVYTIIDTATETNVDQLNIVSTGLTAEDFDPYQQGHCVHTRLYKGYRVAATTANSKHQGGVTVAWRVEPKKGIPQSKPNQDIESFQQHGPNCLSYHALFGGMQHPVIVAYLLPNTLEDLHHVQAALIVSRTGVPLY